MHVADTEICNMMSGMHHKSCTVNEVLQTLVPDIVLGKVFKRVLN